MDCLEGHGQGAGPRRQRPDRLGGVGGAGAAPSRRDNT